MGAIAVEIVVLSAFWTVLKPPLSVSDDAVNNPVVDTDCFGTLFSGSTSEISGFDFADKGENVGPVVMLVEGNKTPWVLCRVRLVKL